MMFDVFLEFADEMRRKARRSRRIAVIAGVCAAVLFLGAAAAFLTRRPLERDGRIYRPKTVTVECYIYEF